VPEWLKGVVCKTIIRRFESDLDLKMKKIDGYIKANRKGSRDAELENETGWKAKNKIHKSKKNYDRKKYDINKYMDL
jgi:hypothetical protein